MIGFAKIAGGPPSSAGAMVDHLCNQTLTPEQVSIAAYYGRGMVAGEGLGLAVVRPDTHPSVLIGLGIDPHIPLDRGQINALLAGRRASGDLVEGKTYAKERRLPVDPKTDEIRHSTPIGSYDFCPMPDKSVSVAWGFAEPVEQAMIYNAHREASREAVAYIAGEVGKIRLGKGGRDGSVSGHVTWLEFTHHTSRRVQTAGGDLGPGDPDLHTHHLIPNAVYGPDGKVGSLDTAAIGGFIFEADAFYHARLGQKLRDAGFEVELDQRTGAAVMPVVPQDIRQQFSKRTNSGEALARQRVAEAGQDWDALTPDQRTAWTHNSTQSFDQKQKGGKDDVADVADWRRQAKGLGWDPESLQVYGPSLPPLTVEQRHRQAYEIALPYLGEKLEQRSVITHHDIRVAALRGLVETGLDGLADVDAVTQIMRDEGVRQNGQQVGLMWGQEDGKRHVSITTTLHVSDEREFIELARAAGSDKRQAIPDDLLQRHIAASGLDFSDDHGRAQKSAIEHASEARFAIILGAAGMGKTTAIKPLRAAWEAQGREVWGTSLASRQSDDLSDAGIHPAQTRAFIPFMQSLKSGEIKLSTKSVLVVDEYGTLGARQGLELLRHQKAMGFTILALGDDKQLGSIEAGPIVDLTRRALGPDQIPEILTTKRQAGREATIASLLRDGRAAEALEMKITDGRAEMIPGGRAAVIARTAAVYVERLQATGEAPGINAPTNQDAHEISAAVRIERRAMGLVGRDLMTLPATDGKGRDFDLKLAKGDRVRLFESTYASYSNGRGGTIGRNASVLEVIDANRGGLTARNIKSGREGFISWDKLTHGNRTLLAYGDALTISSAQGSSKGTQITAFPDGTERITGNAAYAALTRHFDTSHLITSELAERRSVQRRRPLNDTQEITPADKWANVARSLADIREKDSATALGERVHDMKAGNVRDFHRASLPAEPAHRAGAQFSMAPEIVSRRKAVDISHYVQRVRDYSQGLGQRVQEVAQEIRQRFGRAIDRQAARDQARQVHRPTQDQQRQQHRQAEREAQRQRPSRGIER